MTVTWKNLSVILVILVGVVGYILRFEVIATEVTHNTDKISSLVSGVKTLVTFQCKDRIKKAKTDQEKDEAVEACKPFDIETSH